MFGFFRKHHAKNKIYISDDNEPSVLTKKLMTTLKNAIDTSLEYEDFAQQRAVFSQNTFRYLQVAFECRAG